MKKAFSFFHVVIAAVFMIPIANAAPTAIWSFDEGTGSTAFDSVGGNNGVVYGAQWTTSPLGGALSFDGIDDFVEVANAANLGSFSQITIEAWVNIASPGGQDFPQHYVVDSRDGLGGGFGLNVDTEKIQFWIGDWYPDLPSTIQAGQWHHVVGVYDGTRIAAYVDGVEMGSVPFSGSILPSSTALYIGQRYTFGERFHGEIGEVRIYSNDITAVPAPTSLSLAVIGLAFLRRKRKTQ